jgi:membrane peptidoglycan carboxypeptidase
MSAPNDFTPTQHEAQRQRSPVSLRFLVWLVLFLIFAGIGLVLWVESQSSLIQSHLLPDYADTLSYQVEPGPSDSIRYPVQGPFNVRLGYVRLPHFLDRLQSASLQIDAQARISEAMNHYLDLGLYIPYAEKTTAGLEIRDMLDELVYRFRYPQWSYAKFGDIPPIVWQSLLFIEDRDVLNTEHPYLNPAIDWARFLKAAAFKAGEYINIDTPSMGGSTLATQIEKFRHSDDGITSSITEKLRQIASASLRIYQQGNETFPARQKLVLDYLNTVPLSAAPGYGEVNGLGDGLKVWFDADASNVNRLLHLTNAQGSELEQQGLALRQVVTLMIAHRRPSEYLFRARAELQALSGSYLRLLEREGYITPELLDAALARLLTFRQFDVNPAAVPILSNKGVNLARSRLSSLLGTSLYVLDRLDLSAKTTLQGDLQEKISQHLRDLRDPAIAKQHGLVGEYLLLDGQAPNLRYSFTLFEKTPTANRVRIQTDNTDQPFDINEGSKLELGSTAKVRVLATYLEIITEIWHRHRSTRQDELKQSLDNASDTLSYWTLNLMLSAPEMTLAELLDSALQRKYSASPAEKFFTGSGTHTFGNFKKEDNLKIPSVLESLQQSINLPFVRMLRDIVQHTNAQSALNQKEVLSNDLDPRRRELLNRFIDRESEVFLSRFWFKYQSKLADDRLEIFLSGLQRTPGKLAVIHRYLFPDSELSTFEAFLKEQLPTYPWKKKEVSRLFEQYGRDNYNLQDQGYLARVHPLELWLLGYLLQRENQPEGPPATLKQTLADSTVERREIYSWLLKTKAKNKRDSRIRTVLEVEAFSDIHRRWKKLGYPFDHLVPSLATALGSSGDRPAALTELMSIIQNQGKRLPVYRIESMVFGADTPYETRLSLKPQLPQQVMDPAVAETLRYALSTVVQNGTGRRIKETFKLPDGSALMVGGKTGTGDNRLVMIGPGGQRVKTRAQSRTATFMFYLGDRHFGTLTAFVPGETASSFAFTSALPVQVLKSMAPLIQPYLDASQAEPVPEVAPETAPEPIPELELETELAEPEDDPNSWLNTDS